ncbi:hypothetical protein GUJ93_ZPchr0010g10295 [Zizania palustris]|uniref:Uncharacterized protein n=1 Tax=Zizania palustris TaxID=103762 RepID=A0A8J6BKN8_ZIZPA|nr:hypothetical protein GUJ93_ZPchr0010g10295 [Zizania palustris]
MFPLLRGGKSLCLSLSSSLLDWWERLLPWLRLLTRLRGEGSLSSASFPLSDRWGLPLPPLRLCPAMDTGAPAAGWPRFPRWGLQRISITVILSSKS